MVETYCKNDSYKNVNSSSYKNKNLLNNNKKFVIYYNGNPYFVADNIEQAINYIDTTIKELYDDMNHNNFKLYENLQIIYSDNGAEIIENNPFYIFNYDNSLISLKYIEVNSI